MKISFHKLFQMTSQPDIEVAQAYVNGQCGIQFRRQLHESFNEDWAQLQEILRMLHFQKEEISFFVLLNNPGNTLLAPYTN